MHIFFSCYPKRGDSYFFFTINHAGNLYASPFYGQDETIIPHHGWGCKREFEITIPAPN